MNKIGSYKGAPTLSLNAESRFPFTFGVRKAQDILANLDDIRAFVAKYASSTPTQGDAHDMRIEDQMARATGN